MLEPGGAVSSVVLGGSNVAWKEVSASGEVMDLAFNPEPQLVKVMLDTCVASSVALGGPQITRREY